ncbi:MAG: Carbohydrate kinase, FGGY-like protein [Frankiales bacterium]|nr:Carbohydrate kinase, FGGY-like protein [Frankiales bacterium]
MDVVVGLDCGTTSTKAVVAGADGVVRSVERVSYPLRVPAPGRAELDPRVLRSAVVEVLVRTAARLQAEGSRATAVCVSSAMHGLVAMDDDGTPRGPLQTWADGRGAAALDGLREAAPGLAARTGTPVHPMSPLVKLAATPDARSVPFWGGVKELLLALLVPGTRALDLSTASSSGLYDLRARRWDDEALGLAGVVASQLGDVVATTAVVGGLGPGLGLPVGTPVVAGATDGPLANLGTGAVRPGVVALSLGTSGALRVVVDGPQAVPGLFCYALTEDRWVVGGAVNNGGSAVRWASTAMTDAEPDDATDARLLQEAAQVPPLAEGLLCLPHLLGERAPWWRPGLAGAYVGLRRDHRRGHLVRAAVEGVCQQLALVRRDLPGPVREVRATGGAVTSSLWLRVLTDALDLPVAVADSPEGSGLGACLLGLHALGVLPDLDAAAALVHVGPALQPDPAVATRYRRARPLVEQVVAALSALDLGLLGEPGGPTLAP